MAAAVVLAALGGLIIGSFLNVVAYRLPRGESLSHPRSRCPACGTPIKPYDNIPVLSWLLLRGRCRTAASRSRRATRSSRRRPALLYAAVVSARWDDALGHRARVAARHAR